MGWIKIPRAVMKLIVGPEHTDAQPQIQRQSAGRMPIVLEIGFKNLIAIVGFGGRFLLLRIRNLPNSKSAKAFPGSDSRRTAVKRQKAIGPDAGLRKFVLLGD